MEEALHEQSFSTELEGPEAGGGRGQFGAGPTLELGQVAQKLHSQLKRN